MKYCSRCKLKKPTIEFASKKKAKDKLQPYCRICNQVCSKRYYTENREAHKLRTTAEKKKRKKLLAEYIKQVKNIPCTDCGKRYPPYVMDFDHRDPSQKLYIVSEIVNRSVSMTRLKDEIIKCDVVCSNCHRERTFGGSSGARTLGQ